MNQGFQVYPILWLSSKQIHSLSYLTLELKPNLQLILFYPWRWNRTYHLPQSTQWVGTHICSFSHLYLEQKPINRKSYSTLELELDWHRGYLMLSLRWKLNSLSYSTPDLLSIPLLFDGHSRSFSYTLGNTDSHTAA